MSTQNLPTKYLSKRQILKLHKKLIEIFGGSMGIRDENLLDSAIFAPFQTFDGHDLFPTTIEKAARLGYGIIKNHPFVDGNKRTGTHSMLMFLAVNNFEVNYTDNELIEIVFGVADNSIGYSEFADWLKSRVKILD